VWAGRAFKGRVSPEGRLFFVLDELDLLVLFKK